MQKQDKNDPLVSQLFVRHTWIARNKRAGFHIVTRRMPISIIIFLFLAAAVAVFYAPSLLSRTDTPIRSDAIVLFLGKDSSARIREAGQLLREGYGKVLIIPAHQKVLTARDISIEKQGIGEEPERSFGAGYPRYYVRTHIEVLTAKRMMDSMGLESAIMVSSPYHMHRIAVICERIFGDKSGHIAYVPTRYEPALGSFADVPAADIPWVISEFAKLAWFRLYVLWQ